MSQAAKAQEPSMEEILASIRRIIADDDATKASAPPPPPPKPAPAPPPAPKIAQPAPPPPPPKPAPAPAPAAPKASNNQDDIDAMLAELDAMPAEKEPPPPPPPPPPAPPEKDDILDLTEAMAKPAQPAAGFRTIDGKSDLVFNEAPEKPAPRPAPTSMVDLARRQFEQELGGPTLMSANTTAAVDSAFNTLAHTVLSENARTLEDLVKEMLRPMLKAWLDDNLPGMVERLVRAEIERVSRGRK
jgi:uncharacterized protein